MTRLSGLIAFGIATGGLAGCGGGERAPGREPAPPSAITVAPVVARATQERLQARASVVAVDQALTQARTELSAAEAEHRLAVAWHTRIAALHARSSATDQERDEAEARLAAAAARLASGQAGMTTPSISDAAASSGIDVESMND